MRINRMRLAGVADPGDAAWLEACPGVVPGTTLGHPGTQALKKHPKKHFLGPHVMLGSLFEDFCMRSVYVFQLQFGSPADYVF